MEPVYCSHCGEEIRDWVEYCPNCAEALDCYALPAGFWIRVGAQIIDTLIFFPIVVISFWNMLSLKSTAILILISIPNLLYKPVMESFFGATLGKLACGIKVIDENGRKLSLFNAYVRFLPFLIATGISLAGSLFVYTSSQFQAAESFRETIESMPENPLNLLSQVFGFVVLIDCFFAAFTYRKRALHDMLAASFCVYK